MAGSDVRAVACVGCSRNTTLIAKLRIGKKPHLQAGAVGRKRQHLVALATLRINHTVRGESRMIRFSMNGMVAAASRLHFCTHASSSNTNDSTGAVD